ncbi:hypothetical protein [Rhodanobacter lindaniclasticus]
MGMRLDRAGLLRQVTALIAPRAGWWQGLCDPTETARTCRSRLCLSMTRWLAGLPALGSVLYVPAVTHGLPRGRPLPGLLVEAIELAPLLHTRSLACASAITPDGPREWMECRDAGERVLARLYLLPDTDYLAWDAMQAGAEAGVVVTAAAAPAWQPAAARLLRFRLRKCAGLYLLGADAVATSSTLGRELAARIVRDGAMPR